MPVIILHSQKVIAAAFDDLLRHGARVNAASPVTVAPSRGKRRRSSAIVSN
jgi:hypothetical protein